MVLTRAGSSNCLIHDPVEFFQHCSDIRHVPLLFELLVDRFEIVVPQCVLKSTWFRQ